MSENIAQKLIIEALGAFALCFFSIGAVVLTQGQDIVAIGIATGLAIGIMVAAGGHISGGHYNPAITIGMLATKRIPVPDAVGYIIAQMVGAVLGAGAVTLAYLDVDRNRVNLGMPAVGSSLVADPPLKLSVERDGDGDRVDLLSGVGRVRHRGRQTFDRPLDRAVGYRHHHRHRKYGWGGGQRCGHESDSLVWSSGHSARLE